MNERHVFHQRHTPRFHRTGSVPCDREGALGGPRTEHVSALATSEGGSQRMVVSSEQELRFHIAGALKNFEICIFLHLLVALL